MTRSFFYRACLVAGVAGAVLRVSAQNPSPEPTPAALEPTPQARPTPVPPPPTTRELVDSLSAADLQEVINLLKAEYVHTDELNDQGLARATVQGLLERLGTGATLAAEPADAAEPAVPFLAEILDERIGYLKLGALTAENVKQLDAALENFNAKGLRSVALDLRHTPHSGDFDLALEVIRRFAPQGRVLFTLRRPGAKQERVFTASQEPRFHGLVMILADRDTSGSPEVIAGALRLQTDALVIGERTAGRAVEYSERRLPGGRLLRFAVAEAALTEGAPIYPGGVRPDLPVALAPDIKREIARQAVEKGISQFAFDRERPRLNEAALVAGTNPELDALQAARRNGDPDSDRPPLRDPVLQRAVDLITTITLYETKPGKGG